MSNFMLETTEAWAKIPDFENYEVSDVGNVKNIKTNKYLSQYKNHKGYYHVRLYKNNKAHVYGVHRLMLIAFVGKPQKGIQACHNDGTRDNNILSNLRWDTASNNQLDREKHNTSNTGTRNPQSKLTEKEIRLIRKMSSHGDTTQKEIAQQFNIGQQTVSAIVNYKTWDHVGGKNVKLS